MWYSRASGTAQACSRFGEYLVTRARCLPSSRATLTRGPPLPLAAAADSGSRSSGGVGGAVGIFCNWQPACWYGEKLGIGHTSSPLLLATYTARELPCYRYTFSGLNATQTGVSQPRSRDHQWACPGQ